MNKRIGYKINYDAQTGKVFFVTDCPNIDGVKVASDECVRCRHFRAILFKEQVECGMVEKSEPLQMEFQ